MPLPPYTLDDLAFAFRCYVYYRWHTYCRQPLPGLKQLTADQLEAIHPEIHILELTSSDTEMAVLASLRPSDSVSTAASKLKGAASKTLRQYLGPSAPTKILAGGYFAATTGANTSVELDRYLERQGEHHGYDQQSDAPIWVQSWTLSEADGKALQTPHAVTALRWHLVISTWNRCAMLSREAGQAIGDCWQDRSSGWRVRLQKVSVVPDHIHIAAWSHPTVVPAELLLVLLNSSQELIHGHFGRLLRGTGSPRVWKPGAYVGSYGDLSKDHIRNYMRRWESSHH